ncbi:MAG: hypothetical protein ACC628_24170 [Pirellulaceae bacterium]
MRVKVSREMCLDCCGDSSREVKACPCHDCPLWEYRFGREPEAVRKREPKLLDPVYVVLAGAILDELDSTWTRMVFGDPRTALGAKLADFENDKIAATVAEIRATPPGELFAGRLDQSVGGSNPFEKPGHQNLSVVLAMLMMLAFLVDQTQQLCCPLFAAAWEECNSSKCTAAAVCSGARCHAGELPRTG